MKGTYISIDIPLYTKKSSYTHEEVEEIDLNAQKKGKKEGAEQERNNFRKQEESKKEAHAKIVKCDTKDICVEIKDNLLAIKKQNDELSGLKLKKGVVADKRKIKIDKLHKNNQKLWLGLYDKFQSTDELEILDAVLSIFKISCQNSNKPYSS